MKLLRVSVPNFRNLKNVELTFEPSLRPSVFPIGSENGGGKSTLLQLIFVLLTCSLDDDKIHFLENFLNSFKFPDNLANINNELKEYVLADLELIYKDTKINFHFRLNIKNNLQLEYEPETINDLVDAAIAIEKYTDAVNNKDSVEENDRLNYSTIDKIRKEMKALEATFLRMNEYSGLNEPREINRRVINKYKDFNNNWLLNKVSQKILSLKLVDLADLKNHNAAFSCQTNIDDYDLALKALAFAGEHIYLAVPPTQPYLFLDKKMKKIILSDLGKYQSTLSEIKKELLNFYVYNQLAVTEISHAFKQAKDQDWKTAINNNDLQYGTALKELVEDFHRFLGNDKHIFPSDDMTSIIVRRKTSDNEFIELEPEDLSHGELKRLGLYAWIKYNNINDSIILIDEIENGLHPDWQYNIVNELASWGDNQYLLATHSFYLCEALTPSHVKIIEPKLLNPTSEQ